MGRMLDVVLSNISWQVVRASDVLIDEDKFHPALEITGDITRTKGDIFPVTGSSGYHFRKANFLSLYHDIASLNWSFLDTCVSIEVTVANFYEKLKGIFDKHVPENSRSLGTYPFWFTKEMILLIKRKHKFWMKLKKIKDRWIMRNLKN